MRRRNEKFGFSLVELLVVLAIIGILAALLLPVLNRVNASGKRIQCANNVRQINLAIHMYADDHGDKLDYFTNDIYYSYKECILPYFTQTQNAATNSASFICPSDTGLYGTSLTHFSSYGFNGVDRGSNDFGIAGKLFSSVHEPSKTALDGEISGGIGSSWHDGKSGQHNDAFNEGGFVDGHVSYIKIYWNGTGGVAGFPFYYEPPAGYEYKWTGN